MGMIESKDLRASMERERDVARSLTPTLPMPPTLTPGLATTTESYYDPVPPTDSPLRHAYTLDLAQMKESRDQWKAEAESLRAERAQPHPVLTQALANLQALEAEIRGELEQTEYCHVTLDEVQCWVDKLGTAIADLQEV
jgi:hypothetical protein